MRKLFSMLLSCIVIVALFSMSTSAFASGTNKASSVRAHKQIHSLITAKTLVDGNKLFVSSKVIPSPKYIPPPNDCITIWGEASSIQKFGVVASYNVRANLWNTCGVSLKDGGWDGYIDLECEGAWIQQATFGNSLPNLGVGQQILPLFYYNFRSSCIAADGAVSLPQHVYVPVVASAVRTDNDDSVTGGVDITVY